MLNCDRRTFGHRGQYTVGAIKRIRIVHTIVYATPAVAAAGGTLGLIPAILVFCFALLLLGVARLHEWLARFPYDSKWDITVFAPIRLTVCMLLGASLLGFVYLPPLDTTFAVGRIRFLERVILGAIIGAVIYFTALRRRK